MKEKKEIVRVLAQTEEDRILLAHALDKLETCRVRNYLTHTKFLDLRERTLVTEAVRLAGAAQEMTIWGGFEEAERAVAAFYPGYLSAQDVLCAENSPICLLRAEKSPMDTLTHRDYLGALMGLGLTRTSVGDILVHDKGADIVVLGEVRDWILLEFEKVGRKRITLTAIDFSMLRISREEGEEREGSVATPRLDSVVALTLGISRTEAQALVSRGTVFLNNLQCIKGEKEVCAGDKITVRGVGRVHITAFSGVSRKGRQFLRYRRTR